MNDAKRRWTTLSGILLSGPAFAVGDMPGGPAVRELNFQPPVTAIATDIYQLHLWMIGICVVIFVAVFGGTFVAGQVAKTGDMRVDTPVATMGIRGTAVLVEIDFVVPLPQTPLPVQPARFPPPPCDRSQRPSSPVR